MPGYRFYLIIRYIELNKAFHHYRIMFPDGEIIYSPLEGQILNTSTRDKIRIDSQSRFGYNAAYMEDRTFRYPEFKPNCLTIYSSHQCNLNCGYCYIPLKDTYPNELIKLEFVEEGAKTVAGNCRIRKTPFILGFHGGNEPLLNPEFLNSCISICERESASNGVELLPFCTTNGMVSEEVIQWAAKRFYGITVSWDGPPDIHNHYRRDKNNSDTYEQVLKSVKILMGQQSSREQVLIRCTITSNSVDRMEEITRFFSRYGIKTIEFFPVFQNKLNLLEGSVIPDAEAFVFSFLRAKKAARSLGVQVLYSGSRIFDFHNRFCGILQDNLTLTPDGCLTNCYHHTLLDHQEMFPFFYGNFNQSEGVIAFNEEVFQRISDSYRKELYACRNCFNQFHCSHACPQLCPFEEGYQVTLQPACKKEVWISLAALLELSNCLPSFHDKAECSEFFKHISITSLDHIDNFS